MASFYAMFSLTPAAARGRPRLRRHRLPAEGRGGALRGEMAAALGPGAGQCGSGSAGRSAEGRPARGTAAPASGLCEQAPAALLIRARDGSRSEVAARSGPPPRVLQHALGGFGRWSRCDRRPAVRPLPQLGEPGLRCSAASAASIPRASTTTAPTAATRRCAGPSSSARRAVVREVTDSKLVGRGGAAFPTGRKWEAVAKAPRAAALPRLQRRRVASPAPSRIASSWRRIRSRWSRP